jgi:hypothetical protein
VAGISYTPEEINDIDSKDIAPSKEALAQAVHEKKVNDAFAEAKEVKTNFTVIPGNYRFTFGPFFNKTIEEIDIHELVAFSAKLETDARARGTIKKYEKDALDKVAQYLDLKSKQEEL